MESHKLLSPKSAPCSVVLDQKPERKTAKVSGCALYFKNLFSDNPTSGAKIYSYKSDGKSLILDSRKLVGVTDEEGLFGPFDWPVGEELTLRLEKQGCLTTQSTVVVPEEGFNNKNVYGNFAFQVFTEFDAKWLSYTMGEPSAADGKFTVIGGTVTPPGITLEDVPQGFPGAVVELYTDQGQFCKLNPSYFPVIPYDFFPIGIVKNKTNVFKKYEKQETSPDGGFIFNLSNEKLPESGKRFTIKVKTIENNGVVFKDMSCYACPGVVVNFAPPLCPTASKRLEPAKMFIHGPNPESKEIPGIFCKTLAWGATGAATAMAAHKLLVNNSNYRTSFSLVAGAVTAILAWNYYFKIGCQRNRFFKVAADQKAVVSNATTASLTHKKAELKQ